MASTSLYNKSNFDLAIGAAKLSVITSYRHQIQAGDIAVILDSLQELFRERGDAVTPKHLAERMEHKLHRHVHYTYATYLCSVLGFVTRKGIVFGEKDTRYIVFDLELLAQKRAQYCGILRNRMRIKTMVCCLNEYRERRYSGDVGLSPGTI